MKLLSILGLIALVHGASAHCTWSSSHYALSKDTYTYLFNSLAHHGHLDNPHRRKHSHQQCSPPTPEQLPRRKRQIDPDALQQPLTLHFRDSQFRREPRLGSSSTIHFITRALLLFTSDVLLCCQLGCEQCEQCERGQGISCFLYLRCVRERETWD
jgi:hypothetical protein